MRCPNCGIENSEGAKFCNECASALQLICPSCRTENRPGAKFCNECAGSLTGQPASEDMEKMGHPEKRDDKDSEVGPISTLRAAPEAERRQLTLMFCDIVGSTPLSEQLDPEELREVIHDYQKVCSNVITRFEGHIAKYLGDGILVYFGYPLAHEDDAWRAVNTGLEIVKEMRELSDQLNRDKGISLNLRLGIHTGLVVVGEMGAGKTREPMAIVGDTPNIAQRLQEIAQPNTVIISTATYRLIEGYFNCKALGLNTLKGISHPIEVYQVLHESGVRDRLDITGLRGLTPLIGREQEVGLLLERWERVKEGMGQVVFLTGEPGIGKSRLVQVMKDKVAGEQHTRIESRCSPYHQNTALYPVIDHLKHLLQFKREDPPEEKLGKLEGILVQYGFALEEMAPLFASLLSLPLTDRYPTLNLTPQMQKRKILEALIAWMLKEAEKQPVLRTVEDLHWVDPSTLEYLSLLIEQVPTARILTLFTFRPDFNPPWPMRSHLTQITLNRLSIKQVEKMVERVAGSKVLPSEVVQQVVAKTDGVPLYVEELTKMVIESGLLKEEDGQYVLTGSLPQLAIPATLQDSFMARLDRVDTGEICGLGATLGREFTYDLLQGVSALDEETLKRELAKLIESELLYQRGHPPQARYIFKHALIQDAAYQSLLRGKRQQYHQKIAEVLEKHFPETAETQPELLAHHYTEAGLTEKAIPFWQAAGQRAIERSANVEAIGHLNKGLNLIKTQPESPERTQQELDLLITLGPALTATKGFAASEVEKTYALAMELCQKVEKTPQLFPVLWGQWAFYAARADHKTVRQLSEQLLLLAQDQQDSGLLVEAHSAVGASLFWLGELIPARDHLEQGIALYGPQQHRSHAFIYGQDPGVFCLSYLARALWFLGYPDQALDRINEALSMAQELSHPFSLAFALYFATLIRQLRQEVQSVRELTEKVITLSTEQGFPQWLTYGTILQGWMLADKGQEEGIAQVHQGMADWRTTGAEIGRPHHLGLLIETYLKVGQAEEGLTSIAEALAVVNKNGELYYEAELYRLKGELLLKLGDAEAEACFLKAIDIASRQGAKSLELRAIMSLCHQLKERGKNEEARNMLSEIYGWFTEGFDTADLKEAKALLEELS